MFWANTVTVPIPGISTRYWVLTPLNETSLTMPGPSTLTPDVAGGGVVSSVSFSGLTPIVTTPECRCARSFGTSSLVPAMSTTIEFSPELTTWPVNRLDCPRKLATKAVFGSS